MFRIQPEHMLRLGLGATYVYSGIDLMRHPSGWVWALAALPETIRKVIDAVGVENYLRLQGGVELVLAACFLLWFVPRWMVKTAALLAAVELAAILAFVGVSLVTFRDFGIIGAALGLFFLL
jgi:hypothetical protein